jgi:hypothetical protein
MSTQQHITSSFAIDSPSSTSPSMDTSHSNNDSRDNEDTNHAREKEPLQLPSSDPNDGNVQTLKMGETIKLDHLGPVIINTDGTTRRIDNWDILSEREREVTWRRISKRNEERRKVLLQKQQGEQQE